MERAPEQPVDRLAPGTQVGSFRVVAWQGQGAYGAVYRALRIGQEEAGPVALKVALYSWDARFAREAELLSRVSHPSIPRLLERGVLRHASGAEHAYFAMEWVEGTALYAWAEQHALSHVRLCQVLAQLARALEALHAAHAVHRDVKGDNILVRHSDGRAVLIDFGSGHFQGATRLTWQSLAPCTPAYRSAQASLFYIRLARARDSYYPPTPADDLYALGVTAYRLVMGEYPPPMDVREDESGSWQVSSPDPRPLLENNPRVQPVLREWILRLLSDVPEERGTAGQLAEALEAEAGERVSVLQVAAPPAAEVSPPNVVVASGGEELPERPRPQARVRAWKPWLALAAAGASAVLLWSVQQSVQVRPGPVSGTGPAAVGDTSSSAPLASAHPSSEPKPIAQDPPPDPRPGQTRPDEKGRCPRGKQVLINGGCWVEQSSMNAEECVGNGYAYVKSKCYAPALEPPQKPVPTSSPAKAR